ncbi:isoquinoline 1-oxidoreductase beta subunit [Lacibacter cauensis]|uniref:Isoquinoline 1-oxidoreductase beta subunit n=1 Tax=Lacibacter cauensis TaxID=510947 RepID=A0A562SX36_9BACT|nr:molybdopterin cofactor-binding domain-containing protein [Lacibacter cauensis]TWI85544.1 isoquinoline 1-oxidoreductase beta subunit [Lacibacter cauensis]
MATTHSRRNFLKVSALSGGGMLISFSLLNLTAEAKALEDVVFTPNAYIKINADGSIVLFAPNPEIGQGVKTSLPMIVAEELGVDWRKIKVELAPLDSRMGRQTAGGSGSVRGRFTELRTVGATAREMLIAAAAQQWNVSAAECTVDNGEVIHKTSGRKLSYASLASAAAKLEVPTKPALKDPKEFKLIGTRVQDVDAHKIVTGQPLFGIDTRREGMLFAMVSRPPAYGKTLGEVNDAAALKIDGVKKVVKIKNAVAVLATSTWAAKKGRDALVIQWNATEKLENTAEHFATFKTMLDKPTATPQRNDGDVDAAAQGAVKVLDVTYEIPTLSHGQMEPLNFFANVQDGKVELFGPTQVPAAVRTEVSKQLGIPEANITISSPRQGGGFGRKLMTDNGVEAALISAAAQCPVQVQWTREDDMQNDFYRPAEMWRYRAALSATDLLSWHQSGVGIGRGVRGDSYVAGAIANYRAEGQGLTSNTPTGWWRAPGANTLAYVAESFMDELCTALKKDPVAFRLALLKKAKEQTVGKINYDPEKYKSVIDLVVKMSKWGTKTPGVFRGFSTWFSFGSYVAQVVDVQMVDGQPKVKKVYCAVNCGRVINLSGAENQVQGSIVDGICHAMFPKVTFVNGAVVETNFHQYKFLRMKDAPTEIEVQFVESDEAPTGLGEPALPPVAAALANAIFAATGKRLRKLPFAEQLG